MMKIYGIWRLSQMFLAYVISSRCSLASNTTRFLQLLCSSTNVCRNGVCYTVRQQPKCSCGKNFYGSRCESVNIYSTTYTTIGSLVIVQWISPPRLKGYSFVYYETQARQPVIYKKTIKMRDTDNSALVGNLKSGYHTYSICIVEDVIANQAVDTQSSGLLRDCFQMTTKTDFHTLAGWVIAVIISGLVVLLMYSQRQKIEILYFHRPFTQYTKEKSRSTSEVTDVRTAQVSDNTNNYSNTTNT